MFATLLDPILHAILALALLAAYVVLWCFGHQDTTLLAILGGQLGGLGVSQIAQTASAAGAAGGPTHVVPPSPLVQATTPPKA